VAQVFVVTAFCEPHLDEKRITTTFMVLQNKKNISIGSSTGKVVSRSSAEDGATARLPSQNGSDPGCSSRVRFS